MNEGLALSVQRLSVKFKSDGDGSKKQAAVELIGRCLSSRAIRWGFLAGRLLVRVADDHAGCLKVLVVLVVCV